MSPQDVGGITDIFISAAGTARDDTLIHIEFSVTDLIRQFEFHISRELLSSLLFHIMKDVLQVGIQLLDGVNVAGVERHGDHRADLGQIYIYHSIVVSHLPRLQLLIGLRAVVGLIPFPCLLICCPDGGKTCGFRGHDINADPVIAGQLCHARSYKFHHLILHISVGKCCSDQSQGHILRTYALCRLAVQIDGDHAGALHIVGSSQQLLCQLAAAFTDGHGTQRTVTCMAVGSEDHGAAFRQLLPGILMNDCLMRRYIDPAVFLCSRKTEHVVILIDGTAYRAKGVVAVGKHVGDGELLKSRCPCCLDDTDKCDVVGGHLVKLNLQILHILCSVVLLQNAVSHCGLQSILFTDLKARCLCRSLRDQLLSVDQIRPCFIELNHSSSFLLYLLSIRLPALCAGKSDCL